MSNPFQSYELLNSIIGNMPNIIFWKDRKCVFRGCNTQFAKLAGYEKPEDVIGKNDFDMCWKKFAEKYQQDDKCTLQGKSLKTIEHNINSLKQTNIIYVHKAPLTCPNTNEIIGIIGHGQILNTFTSKINNLSIQDILDSNIQPIILNSHTIHEYFFGLSQAESETLYLLIRGYSSTQIAKLLNKSPRTIEQYLEKTKNKTNTNSKQELILFAIKMGFVYIVPESLHEKINSAIDHTEA